MKRNKERCGNCKLWGTKLCPRLKIIPKGLELSKKSRPCVRYKYGWVTNK